MTASSRINTFLPVFLTICDAQIWPNKHNSYFISMNLANVLMLHMWPVLDAVSQRRCPYTAFMISFSLDWPEITMHRGTNLAKFDDKYGH